MSNSSAKQDDDVRLSDFWSRRNGLSKDEYTQFCLLIIGIISKSKASELEALPEGRDFYINGFIMDKILQPKGAGDYLSSGGLHVMYRNYLRDQLRSCKRRKKIGDYSSNEFINEGAQEEASWDVDNFQSDGGFYSEGAEICSAGIISNGDMTLLGEHELTVESVAASAGNWLSNSEKWVAIYLAHNFCPDKEMSEPLVHLASRFSIPSYHYKAQKLGINWNYDKARSDDVGYARTLIGMWLTEELGIPIEAENEPVIRVAFNLLCLQALYWGETVEETS